MEKKLRIIIFFIVPFYFFILGVTPVLGEFCEQHDFGSPNIKVYIYSDEVEWDFTAENNMVVNRLEVRSVTQGFYISTICVGLTVDISINGNSIANWITNSKHGCLLGTDIHIELIQHSLKKGDTITYKIHGGVPWQAGGYISGPNYVKLCEPTSLTVTPVEGFNSSGDEGGPFNPSSKSYILENTSDSTISWNVNKSEDWVSLSTPTSGTLGVGENRTVTVSINSNANGLSPGDYQDTVNFINITDGSGNTTRSVDLTISTTCALPFEEDFETGTLGPYWITNSTQEGRIQITGDDGPYEGNFHLTMDDSTGNTTYSLNELILAVDLAGQTGVMLSFFHKEFEDEDHEMPNSFTGSDNSDGVAISEDGVTWYKVQGLTSADDISSDYKQFIVDLDAVIASAKISNNKSFFIKFQQYDNYQIASDGFAFDNIRLYFGNGYVGMPWIPLLLLNDW